MRSLKEIIQVFENKGITAYEIAKNTDLTEVGINKIFNGESKKPHKSTIKALDEYINNFVFGKSNLVNELEIGYKPPLTAYSDLEILEHIAKNIERFSQLEMLKILVDSSRLDEIERRLDEQEKIKKNEG